MRVVWDTSTIGFSDLLKLFWECHDPTQGDRQGNDCGSQYRSTIYANDSALIELASASAKAYQELLSAAGFAAITTEIRQGCRSSPLRATTSSIWPSPAAVRIAQRCPPRWR